SITHDANGSITAKGTTTLTWNAFGNTASVKKASNTYNMVYDAEGKRVGRRRGTGREDVTTLGTLYERAVKSTGSLSHVHLRIMAQGRVVAQLSQNSSNPNDVSLKTLHYDALGSPSLVTGAGGTIVEQAHY